MARYFKTIIHYEVLSEDEPFEGSLEDLHYAVMEGPCSGRFLETDVIELSPQEARQALVEQGSDEDFFYSLAKDGE